MSLAFHPPVRRSVRLVARQRRGLDFGPFQFAERGLVTVDGTPTYEAWEAALGQLRRIERGVQFWIGDHLNYGNHAYGEKYAQAVSETEADTWRTLAWVASRVDVSIRIDTLSWTHHRQVAGLDPPHQQTLLRQAARDTLTVSDFKALIRSRAHHAKVAAITAGELPSGEFDVVCADPPWQYDNSGFTQSAAGHYPTMATADICTLPERDETFPKHADPCVLFLWATSPLLPDAMTVLESWGYEYKACLVWVKDRAPSLGWWLKTRHELLLVGVRGTTTPHDKVDSVIAAGVTAHSRKPDEAYAAIEAMFPGLRWVDVFAREARAGWSAWGNEAPDARGSTAVTVADEAQA